MPVTKKKKKKVKTKRLKKIEIDFEAPEFAYSKKIKRIPLTNDLPELPEMPELPELPDVSDVESAKPLEKHQILPSKLTQDIGSLEIPSKKKEFGVKAKEVKKPKVTKKIRPVFIRLDKFKEILVNINEIEDRIKEISEVIKKLKHIHIKEDNEMERWEQELDELKARLEVIEENLSKIET